MLRAGLLSLSPALQSWKIRFPCGSPTPGFPKGLLEFPQIVPSPGGGTACKAHLPPSGGSRNFSILGFGARGQGPGIGLDFNLFKKFVHPILFYFTPFVLKKATFLPMAGLLGSLSVRV